LNGSLRNAFIHFDAQALEPPEAANVFNHADGTRAPTSSYQGKPLPPSPS